MGVKLGFQRTEFGLIPEDWVVVDLESITDPNRTISYGIVQTGKTVPNGIRCLRVVDVNAGQIDAANLITTSRSISDSYKRTILKAGDLVMPLRGKVGDVGQVGEELSGCNLTRGVALIAIRSDWSAPYCRQFLASAASRTRLQQSMNGSALQEIPIATLRSFKIALPPSKVEQGAIAEALNDADALIETLEQLIAKKRQLKQGTTRELLSGRTRLPGCDRDWSSKTIGDLAVLSKAGINPSARPDALFTHYSLPAFDAGAAPVVEVGKSIGSNKFTMPPNAVLVSKLNPRIPRVWAPSHIPKNAVCSTEFLVLAGVY